MASGRARLAMGRGVSVWLLDAPEGFGEAGFHAHHAVQLTLCLRGELRLVTRGSAFASSVLGVAADAAHRIEARGLLVFVFVEPESAMGRSLRRALFGAADLVEIPSLAEPAPEGWEAMFARTIPDEALLAAGRALVAKLVAVPEAPRADPRIDRIIDHAAEHFGPSLGAAAAASGVYLSPSRLRHLFVEQTGLAYKTYLLWLRMNKALEAYSGGLTLTEAAHSAGFADSAHFSRVFKRTFGSPATTLPRI